MPLELLMDEQTCKMMSLPLFYFMVMFFFSQHKLQYYICANCEKLFFFLFSFYSIQLLYQDSVIGRMMRLHEIFITHS